VLHVDQRALAGYRDGLRDVADLQLRVYRRREAGGELDAFASDRVETLERKRDGVQPWTKVENLVLAFVVRRHGSDPFDERRTGGRDGHARQDGTGCVLHDAGNGARLGGGGRGEKSDQRYRDDASS